MPAAKPQQNPVASAEAAELAAHTSSLMEAQARRYADLAGGLQRVLQHARKRRNAAWSGSAVTPRKTSVSLYL